MVKLIDLIIQQGEGPMKDISVLGIDLAKSVFQLHDANQQGTSVLKKKLTQRATHGFCSQSTQMFDRDGGLWRCTLLGLGVPEVWS